MKAMSDSAARGRARELAEQYEEAIEHRPCFGHDRSSGGASACVTHYEPRDRMLTVYCRSCGATVAHHQIARAT